MVKNSVVAELALQANKFFYVCSASWTTTI